MIVSIKVMRETLNRRRFSSTLATADRHILRAFARNLAGDDGEHAAHAVRGQELHLGHSAGSGGHHHGLRGTTMAAPGGVPASSSWTTPIAGPDWRREKATRQDRVRVWKWEGGMLVMFGKKGRDGAATVGALHGKQ